MSVYAREQGEGQPLTEKEKRLVQRLLSDPFSYPMAFKTWHLRSLETSDVSFLSANVQGLDQRLIDIETRLVELEAANIAVFLGTPGVVIPAAVWTQIPLVSRFGGTGGPYFEVGTGANAGTVVCLATGVYVVTAAVVFDPSLADGECTIRVRNPSWSPVYWAHGTAPAPKTANVPVMTSYQVAIAQGEALELDGLSTYATSVYTDPNAVWLSVVRLRGG